MARLSALLCLWCACASSTRPVANPRGVLAALPEKEHHRALKEPLHISAAAQHNLSKSYQRYIQLKRGLPEQTTGCCATNAAAGVCWGCGSDGLGWCHGGKDNCDPKCNGTWISSAAPPTCEGPATAAASDITAATSGADQDAPTSSDNASPSLSPSPAGADNSTSLSRRAVQGGEEKTQRQTEHEKQLAINEVERQRQKKYTEAAHDEAPAAQRAAEADRRELHNQLNVPREAEAEAEAAPKESPLPAHDALLAAARREAEAARQTAEEAHQTADAHRADFEAQLEATWQLEAQRAKEAARFLAVAPVTAAPVAAVPVVAAPVADAASVNSYGETVPSADVLRLMLQKAGKGKPAAGR